MKTSDLRVISGCYKGQKLRSPESALTHPMGAREKLALFNLLQPAFLASTTSIAEPVAPTQLGPKVLDLYAGSGALGIEALSRGAREVVFVEKSPKIARLISENLSNLNPTPLKTAAKIFSEPVNMFCQRQDFLSYFDIIIADPPYDNFRSEDLASISQILNKTGILVLSSPAKVEPPELLGLQQETTRTYAAARLTVYQKML